MPLENMTFSKFGDGPDEVVNQQSTSHGGLVTRVIIRQPQKVELPTLAEAPAMDKHAKRRRISS